MNTSSNKRTPQQHKQLFALLYKLGIDDDGRKELVYEVTQCRTTTTTELTQLECADLINSLQTKANIQEEKKDRMRKKIIAMAHEMKWYNAGKVDLKRIDDWCVKSGKFKKPLMKHSQGELTQLVTQFEHVAASYKRTNG